MSQGTILNIQRFCTDDGPGIRTTVFLKGCPLKCIWCHNPESQNKRAELMYDRGKCIGCGKCVSACPNACHSIGGSHVFSGNDCVGCGKCAVVCPAKALELYGKEMHAEDVFEVVKRDQSFYDATNGGITVSGGEPLYQADFTKELLHLCKKSGIHTAIETCGYTGDSVFEEVIRYCNLVLFDIKETDEEKHIAYTGHSLQPILRNLTILNEKQIPFIIRAPIVPTLNDREEHFKNLKYMLDEFENCKKIQIMPYHDLGSYKYEKLGRPYHCENIARPTAELCEEWKKILTNP